MRALQTAVILLASSTLLGGVARAETSPQSQEELIKAGRYGEAYERAVKNSADTGTSVTSLAYTLLEQSLASPDSFQRWFALRAARTLRAPALVPSLRKMAREGDRYEQSLALDALILTAPREAREEFIHALSSPYRPVRLRGLRGLSEQADPELAPNFSTVLINDSDADLRALAARALGRTGSPNAVPALRRALNDSSEVVQEEAVQGLAKLGDTTLGDTLSERLAGAANPEMRVRLIRLLGFVPDPHALETLGKLLADGDPEVRAYAAASIVRIKLELEKKP